MANIPAASSDLLAVERRVQAALRQFGERITPLEKAAAESIVAAQRQEMRHEVVVNKIDALALQVSKSGDRADSANDRCDDLNTRMAILEVAWSEQMRPGLERLRNLELKLLAATVIGAGGGAGLAELLKTIFA